MGDAVELVNVRAVVRRELPGLKVKYNGHRNQAAVPSGRRWSELDQAEIAIVDRESISAAANVIGPAIVEEVDSSHYIPLGWTGRLGKAGSIIVERGE